MTSSSDQHPRGPETHNGAKDARSAMAELLRRSLGGEDIRESTASVARPVTLRSKDVRSFMVMRVGEERLALPAQDVARVTPALAVHRIPHRSSEVVRGLCNIDGGLVLTAAIENLLQIPADDAASVEPASRRMVVIGGAGTRWAFAVDEVLGVQRLDAALLRDLPVTVERALGHFGRAIAPLDDGQATVLDPEAIVATLDRALR